MSGAADDLIANYLAPLGYGISAVHTGREGLRRAIHGRFATVILDVMLSGLNGVDVLRELRRHSQVPVLMLTALGAEPDRIAWRVLGPKSSSGS